jgi:hypothetical protein
MQMNVDDADKEEDIGPSCLNLRLCSVQVTLIE